MNSNSIPGVWAAKRGMFSTCDVLMSSEARRDPVLAANARTSMDDYRLALSMALGKPCDRNGYYPMEVAR